MCLFIICAKITRGVILLRPIILSLSWGDGEEPNILQYKIFTVEVKFMLTNNTVSVVGKNTTSFHHQ